MMQTIALRTKNIEQNVKNLIELHNNVIIESTTYTTKVKTPEINYLFADTTTSKKTLIAAQKIKSDINKKGFKIFETEKNIHYFNFSENIPEYIPELFCIDINAAYPNELFKQEFITKKTFDYLIKNISKTDRLKSLGMLATNKIVQEIENKKIKSITQKENKTACIFFKISHSIGEILNNLFLSYPSYCFFFWVDGIFVKKEIAELIKNEIESFGYSCKIEPVKDLIKKNNYLIFDKYSEKRDLYEKKIIFLPKKKNRINKEIWNFIN